MCLDDQRKTSSRQSWSLYPVFFFCRSPFSIWVFIEFFFVPTIYSTNGFLRWNFLASWSLVCLYLSLIIFVILFVNKFSWIALWVRSYLQLNVFVTSSLSEVEKVTIVCSVVSCSSESIEIYIILFKVVMLKSILTF